MKFTVITVTLNAGDKLIETVTNILKQTNSDYELLIKDGGSTDGSMERLPSDSRIRIVDERDKGIYDAMNQAVAHAMGDYIIFMNCGDFFYKEDVLDKVAKAIDDNPGRGIFYGDAHFNTAGEIIHMPKEITDFVCYRHIPCHQACIFERKLFEEGAFDLSYKIRADYEFFLRQYFTAGVKPFYVGCVVADYEGGGFSETKANRKRDKKEHERVICLYMKPSQIFKYKTIMVVTLQPLRKFLAQKSCFAGVYDRIKTAFYRKG